MLVANWLIDNPLFPRKDRDVKEGEDSISLQRLSHARWCQIDSLIRTISNILRLDVVVNTKHRQLTKVRPRNTIA